MSEIKKGDLVMLVRGHACLVGEMGGIPFECPPIELADVSFSCSACLGKVVAPPSAFVRLLDRHRTIPVAWLLKIDPPEQSTDTPTREDLHEPA